MCQMNQSKIDIKSYIRGNITASKPKTEAKRLEVIRSSIEKYNSTYAHRHWDVEETTQRYLDGML